MSTAIGAGPGMVKGDAFVPPQLKTKEDRSKSQYLSSGRPGNQELSSDSEDNIPLVQLHKSRRSKKIHKYRSDLPEDVIRQLGQESEDLSPASSSEDEYKPSGKRRLSPSGSSDEEPPSKRSKKLTKKHVGNQNNVGELLGNKMSDPCNQEMLVGKHKIEDQQQQNLVQTSGLHSPPQNFTKSSLQFAPFQNVSQSSIPSAPPPQTLAISSPLSAPPPQSLAMSSHQSVSPPQCLAVPISSPFSAPPPQSLAMSSHQSVPPPQCLAVPMSSPLSVPQVFGPAAKQAAPQILSQSGQLQTFGLSPMLAAPPQLLQYSQSPQSLQMAEIALQSQSLQAQAMQAQALQSQMQFFLQFQAQLAAQQVAFVLNLNDA